MSEEKHTAGPWFHHVASGSQHTMGGYISNTEDRNGSPGICDVRGTSGQPFLANARLIACAPELLEALKDLLEYMHPDINGEVDGNMLESAEHSALQVIAKATGGAA